MRHTFHPNDVFERGSGQEGQVRDIATLSAAVKSAWDPQEMEEEGQDIPDRVIKEDHLI